jgi:endonuclease VIII
VLRADARPDQAWARITKSRTPIGQLLMDQSIIAGIGNIYRSEILWRQRVNPQMPGSSLDRKTFDRLWEDAVHLLAIGVKHNAIITVDKSKASSSKYGERVNIFNKAECPACSKSITAFEMAGRRAFMCEACQPAF